MAFEEHSDFLELFRKVMFFAIDDVQKKEHISAEEFLNHLYTSFLTEDEEAVKRAVQSADRFMIVVAPLGGGKSTIIHNALRTYAAGEIGCFLFDFKNEMEKFYSMRGDSEERMLFIQNRFKKELAKQFLHPLDNVKIKFIFTALCMFFEEERLHNRILKWRGKYDNCDIGKNKDDLEKLFYKDPQATAEEETFVKDNLTCAQMISAIKATLDLEKFLIVIDNVDRLPVVEQPILFSVAIDIHHGGKGEFGTIVTVRNKNLMRYEEAGGNGDFVEVVSLVSQVKERTKPIRLHPPTAEFALKLLENRHTFVEKLKPPAGTEKKVRDSMQLFHRIKPYVNQKFVEERFYNLANHSYRHMLVLNSEFVAYLLRLASEGVITNDRGDLLLDDPSLLSYLYRWVYATHNPNHEFLLDIVSKYDRYFLGVLKAPLDCDIEVVILAWLTNNQRFLRVYELLQSFHTLGVNSDAILGSLYHLYDVRVKYRYVELGDSEKHFSFGDLCTKDPRITLTPLGAEFVESTLTKFEFLYQCRAYPNVVSINAPEMLKPVSENMDAKVSKILEFLRKMKEVHTASLLKIKDACSSTYPDWEEYYRNNFCVKRKLVLERTISSHLIHLKKTHPSSYSKWRPEYERLLRDYHNSFDSSWTAENILTGLD